MGIIQGFKYDVFVSYAQGDNLEQAVPKGAAGWVEEFVRLLVISLEAKLRPEQRATGRDLDIFWDYRTPYDSPIPELLCKAAEESALVIAIMSQSYLDSIWCKEESNRFVDILKIKRANLFTDDALPDQWPLIVVQVEETDGENWPDEIFAEAPRFKFYDQDEQKGGLRFGWPSPDVNVDAAFFKELSRLSTAVAYKLRREISLPVPSFSSIPNAKPKKRPEENARSTLPALSIAGMKAMRIAHAVPSGVLGERDVPRSRPLAELEKEVGWIKKMAEQSEGVIAAQRRVEEPEGNASLGRHSPASPSRDKFWKRLLWVGGSLLAGWYVYNNCGVDFVSGAYGCKFGMAGGAAAKPNHKKRVKKGSKGAERERVDASIFAPEYCPSDGVVRIQVFLHVAKALSRARKQAHQFDPGTRHQAQSTLEYDLKRNASVDVRVECEGVAIQTAHKTVVWRGRPASIDFLARLPRNADGKDYIASAIFSVDGRPIGEIEFVLKCRDVIESPEVTMHGTRSTLFEKFFFSYSSEDRDQVRLVAQAYDAVEQEFFMDILDLSPGERWEQGLHEKIKEADVLMLFWSEAARSSIEVKREVEFGLKVQKKRRGSPRLVPFPLDGPPPPKPWKSIKKFHMGAPIFYKLAHKQNKESKQKKIKN
ncbi:MAG: toll/interleukin-1 receptor domain-containing protein [Rhodobacteraceae bacterium]|nr:toll/interleukin-1 receptor domain-containing protein [Paracoccaceae bacterium]